MLIKFGEKFGEMSAVGLGVVLFLTAQVVADDLDFSRDIRPILSNKCFTCHGPDEGTREAELRLDLRNGFFEEADSGDVPVVPGDPEESQIAQRIQSDDGHFQMPPPDADHQLTEGEKKKLLDWIEQGAEWSGHWAFETPVRPPLPDVDLPDDFTDWAQNPIDRFVFARLVEEELQPSPAADRETLLRRIYLDLTGLPPKPEDRAAFLADDSPDAYENVVDRLFASPAYGVQMASSWLDAARYADSNGYQNDFGRTMWPWRDWVVDALNQNKTYDEFLIEQIAGDLLPEPTLAQKIATGFNRNNRTVTEGGSIDEEWLVENVIDRVETTSAVFLGLTTGCARCHDHKFDPVSQEEFYGLFAFFNNVNEQGVYNEHRGNAGPIVTTPSSDQAAELKEIDAEIVRLSKKIELIDAGLEAEREKWESGLASASSIELPDAACAFWPLDEDSLDEESVAEDGSAVSDGIELDDSRVVETVIGMAVKFENQESQTVDAGDAFQFHHDRKFSISAWVKPDGGGAIVSRMDKDNHYRGFDVLIMDDARVNVHLIHRWTDNAIKITTRSKLRFGEWNQVTVTYDGSQKAAGVQVLFDTTAVAAEVNNDSLSAETTTDHPLWLGQRGATPPLSGLLADVRLFDSQLGADAIRNVYGLATIKLARTARIDWNDEQKLLAQELFRNGFSGEFAATRNKLAESQASRDRLKQQFATTMVMEERAERRPTYILNRGLYDQPKKDEEILPGVPLFLPGLKPEHFGETAKDSDQKTAQGTPDRMTLARWLVDPANPLTGRVTVNRVWQHHFGSGLHKTPEDFGIQSPLPSHPELLDWLAVEFVTPKSDGGLGWDLKRLHKLIVMSATYRQSSHGSADGFRTDPANDLISRGPRFRLSAEEIRDNALAVSGLLNERMGGPPVKPYQPDGLWKELAGGASQGDYKRDTDDDLYRRSLYIIRKRTVPPPSMTTFDAGSREMCQVARQRTNTPLQALALLNDETYVEAARHLAVHGLKSADNDTERIKNAFLRATLREPNVRELAVLERALKNYRKQFAEDPEAALKLISVGQSPVNDEIDAVELAAFTSVASLLLNLDETITRE